MASATLKEAAARSSQNVEVVLLTGGQSLYTQLDGFIRAVAAALPNTNAIAERTVSNWIPIGLELLNSIPTVENQQTQLHANGISRYVWDVCTAAEFAGTSARISNAQANLIKAAFNLYWP